METPSSSDLFHFLNLTIFLTYVVTFSSWYLVPKIKPNFDPQFQNSTWNSQSRNYFSDLKGKDVVGMKKMLYKECAAWIACRQLLPAIALAAALAWLSAASYCQLNSSFVSAIGHIGFYHKGIKSSDELAPAAFFESTLFRFDEIFSQDLCLFGFWLKTEENFDVIALLKQIKAYFLWDPRIISWNNPKCVV